MPLQENQISLEEEKIKIKTYILIRRDFQEAR